MNIFCIIFGHKQLKLNVLRDHGIISIHDILNYELVRVEICERCKLLFGKINISEKSNEK